jgi:RNA polymerase sigma-70 factor (ECF subfamily)
VESTRANRFERLFRNSYPLVRAYALRRAAPDAAQDAVAETFLVAWRRLEDVPEDSLPWLYGTARRVLANQRRSAARGVALAERLIGATAPDGSADVGDRVADAELLRLALGRLSDRSREALMLVAWEGLDGARAAQAAGCSNAAFAVRLHRARAQLADALASLEGPPPTAPSPEPRSLEVNS